MDETHVRCSTEAVLHENPHLDKANARKMAAASFAHLVVGRVLLNMTVYDALQHRQLLLHGDHRSFLSHLPSESQCVSAYASKCLAGLKQGSQQQQQVVTSFDRLPVIAITPAICSLHTCC